MKSIRKLQASLLLVIAVMAGVVSGCRESERELLATVPDSAQAIAVWDLDKLLKNAGCQVKDGKYELTPELISLMGDTDAQSLAKWLGTFSKVVDINHVVVYMLDQKTAVGTTTILDREGLEKAFAEYGFSEGDSRNGYDIYDTPNGMVFMIKDEQVWFSRRADDVIESVKEAEKEPVADLAGVKEFLLRDNPVNFAYRYNGMTYHWLCGSVKLSDNLMGLSLMGMDDGGKLLDFGDMLDKVNTDFLRYTPAGTQLAAAFSIDGNLPWDSVRAIVMAQMGLSMTQKGMLDMVFDQLKTIDGTVSISAAPAAGSQALTRFDLSSWDLLVMAHQKQDVVNSNVAQLVGTARQFGLKVDENDGIYHANLSQLDSSLGDVYIGNVDGYFAVSTRPFDSNQNNSLTQVFEGHYAAIALDVPYGSETMKALGLPYGLSATLQVEQNTVEVRARFNGVNGSFLSSLISMLAQMK